MITDDQVEQELVWLAVNAEKIAATRAEMAFRTDMLDHVEGVLMREAYYAGEPVTVRKQLARSDPKYLEAIEAKKKATHDWALIQANRERANQVIEVYRTQSANARQGNV